MGIFPQDDLIADTLDANRRGADAISTLHDFEMAEAAAYSGLGQLEGLHRLAPDDENGLFLLMRAWGASSFAFILDAKERAEEAGDEVMTAYHSDRARAAFQRARFYGEELMGHRAPGFKDAQRNVDTLRAWLAEHYPDAEHAEELLWLGYAWLGEVAVAAENPETVADLWVGVTLLEHSVKLDPTIQNGTGHTILGAYHARSAMAELDEAKKHFDRAVEISKGRMLAAQLTLATRYHCMKRDKASWERTLRQIVESDDVFPEQRLTNAIAKRRAQRYLTHPMWAEECGFQVGGG